MLIVQKLIIFFMILTFCYCNVHLRVRKSAFSMKQSISEKITSAEKPSVVKNKTPRISFSKTSEMTPIASNLFRCLGNKTENECRNKTSEFKTKVIRELTKSMRMIGDEVTVHKIEFSSNLRDMAMSRLLATRVKTLRKKTSPFNIHRLGDLFPKQKLFHKVWAKRCVIVSSAGSMVGSNLGEFIDNHDIVMRFNNAPTIGYETDVGNKTTIRIVNSQVVSKSSFNFLNSSLFKNISMVAWDPANINATLTEWFQSPDFDLFTNYQKFMMENPMADFHIIDPRSLWDLWMILQDFAKFPIVQNIPSSGFIGIAILFPICSQINIVEYIPSTRLNGKCHYYSDEINLRCTFGAWHPLSTEKLFALSMNSASDFNVFQKGIMSIQKNKRKNKRKNN